MSADVSSGCARPGRTTAPRFPFAQRRLRRLAGSCGTRARAGATGADVDARRGRHAGEQDTWKSSKPRVVLYNPRAVFYTMPLALLALASALDRDEIEVVIIDGRLEARSAGGVSSMRLRWRRLPRHHRAHRRADPRRPGHFPRGESRAPICRSIWGGWHPSLFPARVPRRAVGRRRRHWSGRRHVRARSWRGCASASRCEGARGSRHGTVLHSALVRHARCATSTTSRRTTTRSFPSSATSSSRASGKSTTSRHKAAASAARFAPIPLSMRAAGAACQRSALPTRQSELQRRYGMRELAFQDETFFTHRRGPTRWRTRSCNAQLGVEWTATLRADQACRMGDALFGEGGASGPDTRDGRRRGGIAGDARSVEEGLAHRAGRSRRPRCAFAMTIGAIFNFIVGFPDEPDDSVDADAGVGQAAPPA